MPDTTGYTDEFFGVDVVPDGGSDRLHAVSLIVTPELSLTRNPTTKQATLGLGSGPGRPKFLRNVKYALTQNVSAFALDVLQVPSRFGRDMVNTDAQGDRVLVAQQDDPSQNGIYVRSGSYLARDTSDTFSGFGHCVFVEQGETFGGKPMQLVAANKWRSIGGPEYAILKGTSPSGPGAWLPLLTIKGGGSTLFTDISVVSLWERNGVYRREQRNVCYFGTTPVGSPLSFGIDGETATQSRVRATITEYYDTFLSFEVYQDPSGGYPATHRLEATITARGII